jgi:hypothetical protein
MVLFVTCKIEKNEMALNFSCWMVDSVAILDKLYVFTI